MKKIIIKNNKSKKEAVVQRVQREVVQTIHGSTRKTVVQTIHGSTRKTVVQTIHGSTRKTVVQTIHGSTRKTVVQRVKSTRVQFLPAGVSAGKVVAWGASYQQVDRQETFQLFRRES